MNIPAIILEMEDYRKKVAKAVRTSITPQVVKEIPKIDLKDYNTIQERVRESFKWVYETQGYPEFLSFCIKMKNMDFLSQDSFHKAKGELAEVFLFYTIKEWIKRNNLTSKWRVYSHYFIPYKSGKGHTEIDVFLISRHCAVVFEAKSFAGEKFLIGDCSIKVRGRITDVFTQNSMHCKALYEHIHDLALGKHGSMKSVLFSFATGSFEDNRVEEKKKLMPLIDEESLPHFLNALEKNTTTILWSNEIFSRIESINKDYDPNLHSLEIRERIT